MNLLCHFTYGILTDPEMIKLAGHDVRSAYKVSVEKPERRHYLENLSIDVMIISY
jgi:hypothetical protein